LDDIIKNLVQEAVKKTSLEQLKDLDKRLDELERKSKSSSSGVLMWGPPFIKAITRELLIPIIGDDISYCHFKRNFILEKFFTSLDLSNSLQDYYQYIIRNIVSFSDYSHHKFFFYKQHKRKSLLKRPM
jgi:hypothetical protein